jgi:hypothetical protein
LPLHICASALIWSSVVEGSTTKTALPFPSWMAFGHSTIAAHLTPSSRTCPQLPCAICMPTKARQLPSFELGKPPKLQPQPKSQLQNS